MRNNLIIAGCLVVFVAASIGFSLEYGVVAADIFNAVFGPAP